MKLRTLATALVAAATATLLAVAPVAAHEPGPFEVKELPATSKLPKATKVKGNQILQSKLLVLEGKDKHALRGTSMVNPGDGNVGGGYKLDGFKKAPNLWGPDWSRVSGWRRAGRGRA